MIVVDSLSARRPPLALARVSFALDAGVHALLGAPSEGGALMLAVLAGREPPRGGSVRVLERRAGDPSTARAIAYVPSSPPLPDALTVKETLRAAAQIRGETAAPAEERLAALGVESLASRKVRTLAAEEARAVALVEALTSAVATVILVDEPFVSVDPRAAALLADRFKARANDGACVVFATASPSDAVKLARTVLVFERGTLVRREPSHALAAVAAGPARVRVVASDPRVLLAELAREPSARDLEVRDGALFVRGDDHVELAAAITRAIVRAGVDIVEMRPELPSVEILGAAATGAAAAAYEAAFSRARAALPAPPARTPGAA